MLERALVETDDSGGIEHGSPAQSMPNRVF